MILKKEEWCNALIERYGETLYKKFDSATVAICGLGGLGSNIAIALARAGIGKLILIDYDKVDITNIHRQQYKVTQVGIEKTEALCKNILEIAPYIEIKRYFIKITSKNAVSLLEKADIVCEAFDNAEDKAMLTNIVLERMPEKYLVAASGMAGMGSGNEIRTRRIFKRCYICGDEKSDVLTEGTLISSRVMICAAHQAHMVLRILAEEYDT